MKIHKDQIRFHLEAMIDPYLEQLGTPDDEARERAQSLLVESFMRTVLADADGSVPVESVVVLASALEYQSKALHNAAFVAFNRLKASS
jgi:hypothetical protein